MSTYKKKQRELRSPDAFQRAGQEAIPWLVQNQVRLLIGVILLVAVGAGVGLWNYNKQRTELREAEAFSNALAPLMASEDAAPKTSSETELELLNALQAFEGGSGGETVSARNAQLLLAYIHLRSGRFEEALEGVESFLAKTPRGNPLRLAALEAKGYALEQSKQHEAAFAAFGEWEAENTQEELRGKGQYHQARMLLLKGEREEALALFEKTAALDLPKNEAVRLAKQRAEEFSSVSPMDSSGSASDDKAN